MAHGWRSNGCFPSECIEDAFLTCEPSSPPAPRVPPVFGFQLSILQQTHLFLQSPGKGVLGFVECSVFKYSWTCLRMKWLHRRWFSLNKHKIKKKAIEISCPKFFGWNRNMKKYFENDMFDACPRLIEKTPKCVTQSLVLSSPRCPYLLMCIPSAVVCKPLTSSQCPCKDRRRPRRE